MMDSHPDVLVNVRLEKNGQERSWLIRFYHDTRMWSFRAIAPGSMITGGLLSEAAAREKARAFEDDIDAARHDGWTDRP